MRLRRSQVTYAFALGAIVAVLAGGEGRARAGHEESPSLREAKAFFEEGTKYYQVGEYESALHAYRASYLKNREPVLLFNIAQCYRKLQRPDDAARQYRAYLRDKPDAKNRAMVEEFIAEADAEIAHREAEKAAAGTVPEKQPAVAPDASKPLVSVLPKASDGVPPAKKSRLWVIGVVAGAVVVAGGATALGVVYGVPNNAADHAGTAGSYPVSF